MIVQSYVYDLPYCTIVDGTIHRSVVESYVLFATHTFAVGGCMNGWMTGSFILCTFECMSTCFPQRGKGKGNIETKEIEF